MQISKQEAYALRLALDLAREKASNIREIASRQRIPMAYLGKIVQDLAHAGVVRTERGARGGVRLAKPPEQITMRQVIEAVQGPIALSRCIIEMDHNCPTNSMACPIRRVTVRIHRLVTQELEAITLADLAKMAQEGAPGN